MTNSLLKNNKNKQKKSNNSGKRKIKKKKKKKKRKKKAKKKKMNIFTFACKNSPWYLCSGVYRFLRDLRAHWDEMVG